MSANIQALLHRLFHANPSDALHVDHQAVQTGEKYSLYLGHKIGVRYDVRTVYRALAAVGLIINNKVGNDVVGEQEVIDLVHESGTASLSDNAKFVASKKGCSFEITFDGQDEPAVAEKLEKAISIITADRDKVDLKKMADKRAEDILKKRDIQCEEAAILIQASAGRNDRVDERTIREYATAQIQKIIPNAVVVIEDERIFRMPSRELSIVLPTGFNKKYHSMSTSEQRAFDKTISEALQEKLPFTQPLNAMVTGVNSHGHIMARLNGGAARLAAEISGELGKAVPIPYTGLDTPPPLPSPEMSGGATPRVKTELGATVG